MGVGSNSEAQALARQLFGDDADLVMDHRREIQRIHRKSQRALEDFRSKSEVRTKEQAEAAKRQAEQQENETKERTTALRRAIDEGVTKHADWFAVPEGDEEGTKIAEAGKAVAESLFTDINPRTGQQYTKEGKIRFHAFIRNAVAAHGPLLHKLTAANKRIGELEAELSEFKESSTLEDAGRKGEEDSSGGIKLAGPEEFYEAEKRR